MASKRDLMDFKSAVKCMDPLEVKDCLVKTLNFLNKNNNECCFPRISLDGEAFLIGLVSDTRNLKCKLFNAECEKIALDIIETLELNKDVFRWTYGHESGKTNEDFFVYKKIFSNKMKKLAAPKKSKSFSLVSHRLIQSQSQESQTLDIPTGSKIQLLNTTLRFLKTDGEGVLNYPDMPLTHAQYMCDIVNSPSDLNVGFGFKSLYAPLFEAMNVYGLDYEFRISYVVKNGDVAALKLEKIRRNEVSVQKKVTQEDCLDKKSTKENSFENSSRSESIVETNSKESNNSLNVSLNSSTSSNRSRNRRRRNRLKLTDGISASFLSDTLQSLIAFTADVGKASVTFEGLNDREAAFVKGVKNLAGSTSSHGSLEAPLRASLEQLNTNIVKALETCKIGIEEGHTKSKARFITLKKVPRDTPTKHLSAFVVPTKSRAFSASSKDSSASKDNLIQFKSAGKLDPSTGEVEMATENVDSTAEGAQGSAKSKDYLNKRQTKLLEAMSVPVDSDKGKRMMQLMGWAGGGLGARGGGILEPILPAIELPVGAGLGHVPPPKPEVRRPADFRLSILHNIRDLLMHPETSKVIEYKLPLTKKEKSYVNTALPNLTKGKPPKMGVKEEVDLVKLILQDMALLDDMRLKADMSQDLRKVTITKCKKKKILKTTQPIKKPGSVVKQDVPSTTTNTDPEVIDDAISEVVEVIDDVAIGEVMGTISHTTCKTAVAIKGRAMRLLFLKKFIDVVRGRSIEREFRFVGAMQKKMVAFLENVVTCVNLRTRCSYVADEEMYLYDELVDIAWDTECYLDIAIYNNSKILLRKMSDRFVARQNVANCTGPKPQDTNNIHQQNKSVKINKIVNQNVANNAIANSNDKSGDENRITNQNEPIRNDIEIVADVDNHKEVTNVKNKRDSEANVQVQNEILKDNHKLNEINIQTSDIKPDNDSVENVAKIKSECDIKLKNNVINSINKDKDIVKKEIKADDDSESSWSTCSENEVDLTIFDKEIEELDKVLGEAGLGFNVRDSETSFSPASDSQDFDKLNAKKTRTRCKNCVVVIAPKSTDAKVHLKMFKTVQTIIWNQIDKEDYAIPLLKCHGVQNGGLVYSCHDERDVSWLKRTIKMAKLNLKVFIFAEDFLEDKKSRKLAIRINSFMPLDAKKVFRKFEMYNDIDTHLWKVLSYESFESYVIFIVEVDEISFEYISEDDFSLYMGIDRAQFSIIF